MAQDNLLHKSREQLWILPLDFMYLVLPQAVGVYIASSAPGYSSAPTCFWVLAASDQLHLAHHLQHAIMHLWRLCMLYVQAAMLVFILVLIT